MMICDMHKQLLGTRWRRSSEKCGFQQCCRKGDRGVNYTTSQIIYKSTGNMIAVGTGKLPLDLFYKMYLTWQEI